jgi:hypothetical protein
MTKTLQPASWYLGALQKLATGKGTDRPFQLSTKQAQQSQASPRQTEGS